MIALQRDIQRLADAIGQAPLARPRRFRRRAQYTRQLRVLPKAAGLGVCPNSRLKPCQFNFDTLQVLQL